MKRKSFLMLVILSLALLLVISDYPSSGVTHVYGEGTTETGIAKAYVVELSRWGIHNDGTDAADTTKGINDALEWASKNGYGTFKLPSGTYLIDKDGSIGMVSNMQFVLPPDAVLQKETNGKENYEIMSIAYGVHDVTLIGGTYRGDKDTHDYSKKDAPSSYGTHEFGFGIHTAGAENLTIDGIKALNFTGDGLILDGYGKGLKGVNAGDFVAGSIDELGRVTANGKKIRTAASFKLNDPLLQKDPHFELSNAIGLPSQFEIYFYKANGGFLKKVSTKVRDSITIPDGAASCYLVFNTSLASAKGAHIEYWYRKQTSNVVVKNSEFAYNRRQGITVGGANNVTITGSTFHDIKGTAPQSGIDVEGGYAVNGFLNSNINIVNNEFYNNAAYDIVLFDGRNARVENNHLASSGKIGLAVSKPFSGAKAVRNHFDGTGLIAEKDGVFIDNTMNDGSAHFTGSTIAINGMELSDSLLLINTNTKFGVKGSDIKLVNHSKSQSGLRILGQPVLLQNTSIEGEPTLRAFTGTSAEGSIFEGFKVTGYNTNFSLDLPPGTYTNCEFQGSEKGQFGALNVSQPGKYVFQGCTFHSNAISAVSMTANNPKTNLVIKDSTFELAGNTQALNIQAVKRVWLENNTVHAMHMTSAKTELIKLNNNGAQSRPSAILSATFIGNRINANIKTIGISTIYAGIGAPPYLLENNSLINAALLTKPNDIRSNNILK
ncbi:right-handed parallel beta-helix repeat-containing protein [Paenibacillus humicola]|uniref:right-handed parallel beta-helix repeat-containing protein n=1 Tax=Paenibacillus humicola TaxID=3110540 RepID=UPI00237B3C00|nr:right-handed parallel beta-helix repeat-containing protein [Paenibacillus humicola]